MEKQHLGAILIKKEIQKCKENLQYFLDEYGHILTPKGIDKLSTYEIQKDMCSALQHVYNNLLFHKLLRQYSGVSTIFAGYAAKEMMFNSLKIMLITPSMNSGMLFLEKVRTFIEMTPEELRPKFTILNRTKIQLDNGAKIQFRKLSDEAFLGSHPNIIIIDEASFMEKDLIKQMHMLHGVCMPTNCKIIASSICDILYPITDDTVMLKEPKSIFEGFDRIFI